MHHPRKAKGLFAILAIVFVLSLATTAALADDLLDPTGHPKFVNPLPIPARIDITMGARMTMDMRETTQWLGLVDEEGDPLMTTVWGYGQAGGLAASYPGPTFVAMQDVPVDIKWRNKLPKYKAPLEFDESGHLRRDYLDPNKNKIPDDDHAQGIGHLLPVDPTLHMAEPVKDGTPTVVHLHGGHTESASDGLPEAWFTQNFQERGPHWVKRQYHYDNDQEAATLWYHDHALGITRLNVYAGLAGFYLLRDDNENTLTANGVLPGVPYEIEIVIQDRMFSSGGELFYPSTDPEIEPGFDPLPPVPSAIAEFFGDFILVNGVAWPKLDIEPRKYRFRFLNGSDSRFYVLEFRDGTDTAVPFLQIGTDNGLLPYPVPLTQLLFAPGERADLVVDFSSMPMGSEIILKNFGPDDPFKGFNPDGTVSNGEGGVAPPADPATTGLIMKFAVNQPLDAGVPNASVDMATMLRPDIMPLAQDGATRNLVLFEGLDNYGRLQPLLGTLDEGSQAWFEPITENPMLDDIEVWEVYNATEDAHPIHLHLVSFQIIDRESFVGTVEEKEQPQHNGANGVGGKLTVSSLGGDSRPPEPNEMGWKDTAVMLPGEVTRVIAKFDREGRYVWHCHILSHEDHEMMRPYHVGPIPPAMVAEGGGTTRITDSWYLGQNAPNPSTGNTAIRFRLAREGDVELKIYDVQGRTIRTLANGSYPLGEHELFWDGRDNAGRNVASGVYFYRLRAGSYVENKRMILMRSE